jgi:transporter family protein
MKVDYQMFALCGLTLLLWGVWGFCGKVALDRNVPAPYLFLIEVVVSLFLVLGFLAYLGMRSQLPVWPRPLSPFAIFSGLGLALGLLSYYFALNTGKAAVVVPLTALYPAVAVVLSFFYLHERLSAFQWAGVVFAVLGAVLLLSGPVAHHVDAKKEAPVVTNGRDHAPRIDGSPPVAVARRGDR